MLLQFITVATGLSSFSARCLEHHVSRLFSKVKAAPLPPQQQQWLERTEKSRSYSFQPLVLTEVDQNGDEQTTRRGPLFPCRLFHYYRIVCNDSEIFCVSTQIDEMWRFDVYTKRWTTMLRRRLIEMQPPQDFSFLWNGMVMENDMIVVSG